MSVFFFGHKISHVYFHVGLAKPHTEHACNTVAFITIYIYDRVITKIDKMRTATLDIRLIWAWVLFAFRRQYHDKWKQICCKDTFYHYSCSEFISLLIFFCVIIHYELTISQIKIARTFALSKQFFPPPTDWINRNCADFQWNCLAFLMTLAVICHHHRNTDKRKKYINPSLLHFVSLSLWNVKNCHLILYSKQSCVLVHHEEWTNQNLHK